MLSCYYRLSLCYLHKATATSSHYIEDRECVNNEAELLVWQEGVQQDEAYDRYQHRVHPSVQKTKRYKDDGGAKGTRDSRVEVPEKRGGLLKEGGQGGTGETQARHQCCQQVAAD